jgi:NAD-dependent dihydropyrimidine dehydrogenase PreA subunit
MGTFIRVEIDERKCLGPAKSGECLRICPVNVFEAKDGKIVVKEENEDECTLCNLCLSKCEVSAITIRILYE